MNTRDKKIIALLAILTLAIFLLTYALEYFKPPIRINITLMEKKDTELYKINLESIANEICNNRYQQYSYSSGDYSADIICKDKTEFDLDFPTVMFYHKANK